MLHLDQVWEALTDPDQIKKYMFGSQVETDWPTGEPDRLEVRVRRQAVRGQGRDRRDRARATAEDDALCISPLSGQDDAPENYHTLVYELEPRGQKTRISLSQDGNDSEEAAEHSQANWEKMLSGLKEVVEGG